MVIIIGQYPEHFGLCIGQLSTAEKEYRKAVEQPDEKSKIEMVLEMMGRLGFRAPGLRVEKVKGARKNLFELKITAGGSEHRFLGAFTGERAPDGRPIFLILKYLKKKEWKLSRTAIQTAVERLARVSKEWI